MTYWNKCTARRRVTMDKKTVIEVCICQWLLHWPSSRFVEVVIHVVSFRSLTCTIECLPRVACEKFVELCLVCHSQKFQTTRAPLKPIISSGFMTRGQVHMYYQHCKWKHCHNGPSGLCEDVYLIKIIIVRLHPQVDLIDMIRHPDGVYKWALVKISCPISIVKKIGIRSRSWPSELRVCLLGTGAFSTQITNVSLKMRLFGTWWNNGLEKLLLSTEDLPTLSAKA